MCPKLVPRGFPNSRPIFLLVLRGSAPQTPQTKNSGNLPRPVATPMKFQPPPRPRKQARGKPPWFQWGGGDDHAMQNREFQTGSQKHITLFWTELQKQQQIWFGGSGGCPLDPARNLIPIPSGFTSVAPMATRLRPTVICWVRDPKHKYTVQTKVD